MSKFSNGGYVPSDLNFAEWTEYLNAQDEAYEYQDFIDDMGFDDEMDIEEDLTLSISEKDFDSVNARTDALVSGLAELISKNPKQTKIDILDEVRGQSHSRLVYIYLHNNEPFATDFLFETKAESIAENEKRFYTFININKILETEKFDLDNKELMDALKSYDSVLKTEPWAKKQSQTFERWVNGQGGDVQTVYSRMLDQKLKAMKEAVIKEPEQTKKKYKRDFEWDR